MFKSPGYIAFSLYSHDVYWYGIIMALSILLGLFSVMFIKNKFYKDITTDSIIDISFVLIISGIISARAYYVLLDYKYFIQHPFETVCIWNGGISIQGAILGGIIASYIYAKKNKINFLKYADLFSFGLISGQILGRWGNFFNSEAFGFPTSLPWKLYIPYQMRPLEFKNYEFFHPTFLYESLLNLCVFFVLFFLLKKHKTDKSGVIFFSYIILYSIVRIIVESFRVDSVLNISGIHVAHIASVLFILFGLIGLIVTIKRKNDET